MSRWKKYIEKLKEDPEKYAEYQARRKQNLKNYHERLKEDSEKLSKYKEEQKLRSRLFLVYVLSYSCEWLRILST